MGLCLEDADHAELLCGVIGVIAYLCDKLFSICPKPVTQSFSVGSFICDSSNVLKYTAETLTGENIHGSARSVRMLTQEPARSKKINEGFDGVNKPNLLNGAPRFRPKKCGPKRVPKRNHIYFICGLSGSFGFICEGLNCFEIGTEFFKAADFVCDFSLILKFFVLKALGRDKNNLIDLGIMLTRKPTKVTQ